MGTSIFNFVTIVKFNGHLKFKIIERTYLNRDNPTFNFICLQNFSSIKLSFNKILFLLTTNLSANNLLQNYKLISRDSTFSSKNARKKKIISDYLTQSYNYHVYLWSLINFLFFSFLSLIFFWKYFRSILSYGKSKAHNDDEYWKETNNSEYTSQALRRRAKEVYTFNCIYEKIFVELAESRKDSTFLSLNWGRTK